MIFEAIGKSEILRINMEKSRFLFENDIGAEMIAINKLILDCIVDLILKDVLPSEQIIIVIENFEKEHVPIIEKQLEIQT